MAASDSSGALGVYMGTEMRPKSNHARLTDAGWSYRKNVDRGWIIYKDPETRRWSTEKDSVAILESRVDQRIEEVFSGQMHPQ